MSGVYFHIDVNSAYLSWTAAKRLVDGNPQDIRRSPAVIGGDESSRHGIVLAGSLPAKALGIRTGEPLIVARRRAPGLLILPPDYGLYAQCSRALMELLSQFSPDVFQYSIDEAFIDMSRSVRLFGSPLTAAETIRSRVREELGFTVNIGVAPNKLLAKMASDFEKPDKCHTLFAHEIPSKLWPLPIRELFFVGGAAQRKMENLGIHTIGQLASCDLEVLKAHLGEKYAVTIRGVSDYETACQVILSLCETVGARLRADRVLCRNVCVELKDWEFHTQSHQMVLPEPTDSTSALYGYACRLLREFWDRTPVRLIGVRAGKIDDDSFSQLSLFDSPSNRKKKELEKAVDQIRSKFGVDSIKRASFLKEDSIVDHAASKRKHLNRQEDIR